MSIHHHLDDATVLAYASGSLDESFTIVVASHLAFCAECRAAVRAAEEMGGDLLEQAESAALPEGGFDALMARLTGTEQPPAEAGQPIARRPVASDASDVPLPLQRVIGPSLDDLKWRTVAPGVKKYTISPARRGRAQLFMLSIGPGLAMPEHGHGGSEITLILSGAYRDDMGVFGPGDVADLDEHVEHQPRVEPGAPCICLVAAEAPTRFKGIFARILQPFTRI